MPRVFLALVIVCCSFAFSSTTQPVIAYQTSSSCAATTCIYLPQLEYMLAQLTITRSEIVTVKNCGRYLCTTSYGVFVEVENQSNFPVNKVTARATVLLGDMVQTYDVKLGFPSILPGQRAPLNTFVQNPLGQPLHLIDVQITGYQRKEPQVTVGLTVTDFQLCPTTNHGLAVTVTNPTTSNVTSVILYALGTPIPFPYIRTIEIEQPIAPGETETILVYSSLQERNFCFQSPPSEEPIAIYAQGYTI